MSPGISSSRLSCVAATAAALAFALGACGGDSGPSAPAPGGADAPGSAAGDAAAAPAAGIAADAATVNLNVAPASLDPGNLCSSVEGITGNFYSRLVRFGSRAAEDGTTQVDQSKIEGDLATDWTVSDDGRTYTFRLRDDARFAGGGPVDADAVVFTFDRVREMELCSAYGVETSDVGNVRSVEAVDPTTVRIRLRQPNPALIKAWATAGLGVVDPQVVRANGGVRRGQPNEYMAKHSAGSGPYVVAEYEPNQRLVMEANPDYYGEAPKTRTVTVNFVTSDSTLQLQARDGTADVTYGMTKLAAKGLESDPAVRVLPYESTNTEQVVLNWAKPPLDDVRFREALATAVPYEALVDRVAQGFGVAFHSPILPSMPYFEEQLGAAHPTDVEAARRLVQESGVQAPVKLTLNIPQGNPVQEQLATILQDAWKEIGVEVSVRKLDQAAYTDALFGNDAQASLRRDGPLVNDPDYYLGYDLQCAQGGTENTGNVCIEAADRQLAIARRSLDEDVRTEAYHEAISAWREQTPKIFLYLDEEAVVLNRAVTSFEFDPTLGTFAALAKGGS